MFISIYYIDKNAPDSTAQRSKRYRVKRKESLRKKRLKKSNDMHLTNSASRSRAYRQRKKNATIIRLGNKRVAYKKYVHRDYYLIPSDHCSICSYLSALIYLPSCFVTALEFAQCENHIVM